MKESFVKDTEVLIFCIMLFVIKVTSEILIHYLTI